MIHQVNQKLLEMQCGHLPVFQTCMAGYGYNNHSRMCEICPPGYFSPENALYCVICPMGSATNIAGRSVCNLCSVFSYASQEGQHKCTPCPENSQVIYCMRIFLTDSNWSNRHPPMGQHREQSAFVTVDTMPMSITVLYALLGLVVKVVMSCQFPQKGTGQQHIYPQK